MENKLSAVAAPPDLDASAVAAVKAQPRQGVRPEPASGPEPDLRLVIEESGHSGAFVYKTIDRRTGEVVQQLPREEVLRLRDVEAYVAGTVIATQA